MKPIKIFVKDVKGFIKEQEILYASDGRKRFFIKLQAGPNVNRYIVKNVFGEDEMFTKIGVAVKYFNEL